MTGGTSQAEASPEAVQHLSDARHQIGHLGELRPAGVVTTYRDLELRLELGVRTEGNV